MADFLAGSLDIRARYPFVTDRACAMLHVRRAGFMNASKLGHWLLERARAHGVELVRDEVTALDISQGRVVGVSLASGSRIDTRKFVLAAGPLLPRWTDRLGLGVPVVNELHGKISFEDEAGVIPRDAPMMIWNDGVDFGKRGRFPGGVHLRPRGDRSILGVWTYDTRIEEPRFPPAFDGDYADIVLRGLTVMVPGLSVYAGRGPTVVVDGGYYCKTPDNRPLVGPTAIEGAYVLGALSGFGIMASQAAAELLAAGMLGQPLPEYAGAFHPARFDSPDYQSVSRHGRLEKRPALIVHFRAQYSRCACLPRTSKTSLAATVCLVMTAHAAALDPIVAVTGGQIRGLLMARGGAEFKGVPFAKAPVGDLRWREPLPALPWTGVRDATTFGAPCPQNAANRPMDGSQEDCLFLNLWTPDWPPAARRPVMVWMHGGGNYAGSSSNAAFNGESLARRGVVLVSLNYRLGILGFFAHSELTRESERHASGNYGLMDQIAALKWVRDNIAAFGGDAGNVTIFGQSAGAVDVNVLMTSPIAAGLFHKVIAESGTVTRVPDDATVRMTALGAVMAARSGDTISDALTREEAEKAGDALGSLSSLRERPVADLLKVMSAPRMSIGPANGIVIDGWIVPKPPADVFTSGRQHRAPLLIGSNARERTPPQTTATDLVDAAKAMYGPLAPRAMALYGLDAGVAAGVGRADDPLTAAPRRNGSSTRCTAAPRWRRHRGTPRRACPHTVPVRPRRTRARSRWRRARRRGVVCLRHAGRPVQRRRSPALRGDADVLDQFREDRRSNGRPGATALPRWPRFDDGKRQYLEFTDEGPIAREGLRRPYCDLYLENLKRLQGR